MEAPEFVHYNGVWIPLLRVHSNLSQIGNAARAMPGSQAPYAFDPVPDPQAHVDHRPLLENREFLNAIVEKLWIEDSVLLEYEGLEVRVRDVLERLQEQLEV
jgi:hypothetical protein